MALRSVPESNSFTLTCNNASTSNGMAQNQVQGEGTEMLDT